MLPISLVLLGVFFCPKTKLRVSKSLKTKQLQKVIIASKKLDYYRIFPNMWYC